MKIQQTKEVLRLRIGKHGRLKIAIALWLILWINFVYFFNQHFVFFPIHFLEPGVVDQAIPFVVESIFIYICLYPLIPLAALFMQQRRYLIKFMICFTALVAICGLVFFFYPTWCPRPPAEPHWMYDRLLVVDRPLNSLPSMHVAMAIYSAAAFELVLQKNWSLNLIRLCLWTLVLAICLSTMTLKQHMFIDVVGGAIIGIIFSYLLLFRKTHP